MPSVSSQSSVLIIFGLIAVFIWVFLAKNANKWANFIKCYAIWMARNLWPVWPFQKKLYPSDSGTLSALRLLWRTASFVSKPQTCCCWTGTNIAHAEDKKTKIETDLDHEELFGRLEWVKKMNERLFLICYHYIMNLRKSVKNIAVVVLKICWAHEGHFHCLLGICIVVLKAKKINPLLRCKEIT